MKLLAALTVLAIPSANGEVQKGLRLKFGTWRLRSACIRDPGEPRGILDPVARFDRTVVAVGFERYIRTGRFLCAL
jgi:hypothetical protein